MAMNMTHPATPMRVWWSNWWPLVAGIAGGAIVGLPFGLVIYSFAPSRAEIAACDRAVNTLLSTEDPLELYRAGVLVQSMRCDVARRLALHTSLRP